MMRQTREGIHSSRGQILVLGRTARILPFDSDIITGRYDVVQARCPAEETVQERGGSLLSLQ